MSNPRISRKPPGAKDPTTSGLLYESLICWSNYRLNNIVANNKLLPLKRAQRILREKPSKFRHNESTTYNENKSVKLIL
jgi:hypothetical protein